MKRICAWCGKDMGVVEDSRHPDSEVSHGMCSSCADNLGCQNGMPFQRYLDSLPLPVLVVDANVVVMGMNRSISRLLNRESDATVGRLGGDVFECAHARRPEGCGKTVHCSGCAIRRTVTRTYETGEPQFNVPATLRRDDPESRSEVALSITTIKTGDIVVLRIEGLSPAPAGGGAADRSESGGPAGGGGS